MSLTAQAGEHRFSILLDTDNAAATGCSVATSKGTAPGIEQVWTTVVTTTASGATVTRIERQTCVGGVMGPSTTFAAPGWSAGIGNGVGGTAPIETYVPLALLPQQGTMKAFAASINATGGQDATTPFLIPLGAGPAAAQPIPLSPWLVPPLGILLLLLAARWVKRRPERMSVIVFATIVVVSGLVWAGTVILDGNVGDWAGITPVAGNAKGSAPIDANIVGVYYQSDANNLYFRTDADVRPDAPPVNQPPVVAAGPDQTITLPAVATLNGTATDDGLPNPPGALTTTWSTASGPGSVVFGNVRALSTTATFSIAGSYVLRLTASDSALSTSSTLTITVNDVAGSGPQFAPIADRTIALGARFQQLLQATSPSLNETLTLALPAAPSGATLNPSPLIDWTPTAAQVGLNSFTATATDSQGRTATVTFKVTVTHVDQPPQLAPQADETVRIGTSFTRALKATDPDAGDTLTFALVNGPAGMVLNGNTLSWTTAGKALGDYPVTVKVTDSHGLSDTRTFTITLLPIVLPVAVDDNYSVRLGETLTVAALGVLANDLAPVGANLTASKISNPDKGTLNSFNADGSFTFTAPAAPAGPVFAPTLKWNNAAQNWAGDSTPLVADVFANGKPVVFAVRRNIEGGITAIDGATGTTLWTFTGELPAPNTGCYIQGDITGGNQTADSIAVGDIDDSGVPAIVASAKCLADGAQGTRMIALNARTGAVKWLTPPLGAYIVNSNNVNFYFGMTYSITPVIARLHPAETPSVLFKVDAESFLDNANIQRSCDQFQVNSGLTYCTGIMVLNGADGSVRHRFIAPNDGIGRENFQSGHLIVADLTGNGTLNLIANGAVWDADGNLISNRLGVIPRSIALAKLDDSGQVSIISYEIGGGYVSFIVARHADGTVQWQTPIDATTVHGLLSVADLDGDGSPEIMATAEGNLYVYGANGQIKWSHRYADANNLRTIDIGKRPAAFDLDGDGIAEVIIPTTFGVEFTDGATGKTKKILTWAELGVTNTGYGGGYAPAYSTSAIVADIDGSGHASIVITVPDYVYGGDQYVVAIGATKNDWRPAPTVFNEFSYHVTNVDNTGRIPTVEANAFATPRTNIFGTQAQTQAPVDPRVYQGTTFTYAASNGTLTSNPATVAIDIRPQNRPPVFTSVAPTAYVPVAFTYAAHATDPDPGDRVTYSLLLVTGNGAASCSVDANSGLVTCVNLFAGDQFFTVVATDTQGASAFQSVHLVQSAGPATVPNVVGQSKSGADVTLKAAGFVTGTVSSVYYAAPANQVLTQFPAAGASALIGSAIALQVSLGPQPQAVPNLIGLQLSVARTRLAGIGLGIIVIPVASATAPAGEVVAQNPVFGTLLAPPSPVTVSVSLGPPLTGTVAQVIVQPAPTALRVTGESLNYTATAVFTDGTSADVTIASLWDTSAPAVASVDSTGSAKALTPGTSTISAKAGGVTGQSTLTVVARTTGDNVTPVAQITLPADGASVSGPTTVTGTATDANFLRYELAVALAGDTSWTTINEGTTAVTAGTLGTFDPTTLLNDIYTVRLTVFDRNGNQTVATTTVQVTGGMKPGLFTLAFQDLNVPVGGVPITVTRTYDSRDKGQGDFGVGWRLTAQSLRLRTNRVPGTGWVRQVAGPIVSLTPTSEHKVSVTLPSGRVDEFDLVLSPTSGFGGLDATAVVGYAPRPGTTGKLEALANPNLLILNGAAEDELVDDTTLNAYNPQRYRYTLSDGTQVEIHLTQGVKKITDANGNSIAFDAGGILHSSGTSIVFARDGQGRITQVTDPSGRAQSYSYDANGDLVRHTDRGGAVTQFRYDRHHNLIEVVNANGVKATRNEYDASGRLTAVTDPDGRRFEYVHDLANGLEILRAPDGTERVLAYDGSGRVTADTDALGNSVFKTFDAAGNVLSATNALGHTHSFTYDAAGRQTSQTNALGQTTSYTYGAMGRPTSVTDPLGHTSTFVLDAHGNRTSEADPAGHVTTYAYDPSGNLTTRTDALGHVTTFQNDSAGRRTKMIDAKAHEATVAYDPSGSPKTFSTKVTTASGQQTVSYTFAYDAAGRTTAFTDDQGSTTRTEYDALGNMVARVDPLGHRTEFGYTAEGRQNRLQLGDGTAVTTDFDMNGRVARMPDQSGLDTFFNYDAAGKVVGTLSLDSTPAKGFAYDAANQLGALVNELGQRVEFGHDANGQITSRRDALGNTTTSAFDAAGQVTASTDTLGRTTQMSYDTLGNVAQITLPGGAAFQRSYDSLGRVIGITDPNGHSTKYEYDATGNLTAVVDGAGGRTEYQYDEVGHVVVLRDANVHETHFEYDGRGFQTAIVRPQGQRQLRVLDAAGRLLSVTNARGQTINYVYDAANRLTEVDFPDGSKRNFTYTLLKKPATIVDARGTTTFAYDGRGRLQSRTEPDGRSVAYVYDDAGNLVAVTTPAGSTHYTYDANGQILSVTDPQGGVTHYVYDPAGNLLQTTLPNGVTETRVYNANDLPTLIATKNPANSVLLSLQSTFDALGLQLSALDQDGRQVTYGYDAANRLVSEQIIPAAGPNRAIAYTLDAVGNRLTRADSGEGTAAYAYDANNRLLSRTLSGAATAYTYDADGNRLSQVLDAQHQTSYAWNSENRLTDVAQILGAATHSARYGYDANGVRVEATADGVTTRFLVDSNQEISQVLEDYSPLGQTLSSYVLGNGRIARRTGGANQYYHADMRASTRALTDATGSVVSRNDYDAFGRVLSTTGGSDNRFLFVGEPVDPTTDLTDLRARWLDRETGQFLSTDPKIGSVKDPASFLPYAYAKGDPVNLSDPSGRDAPTLTEIMVTFAVVDTLAAAMYQGTALAASLAYGRDVWRGPTYTASASGKLWGGFAGVTKLTSQPRGGIYVKAEHFIFGTSAGFNWLPKLKTQPGTIGHGTELFADFVGVAGLFPFSPDFQISSTTMWTPKFGGPINSNVLQGPYIEAAGGISLGFFGSLIAEITRGALPASEGIAIDLQGYGAGGSWPNTPMGLQASIGATLLTGISLDITPTANENLVPTAGPH